MTGDGMEAISDYASLEEVIEYVYGKGITVTDRRRVAGGDINDAYYLKLSDGSAVFLKENSAENTGFFQAEMQGLEALTGTKTIGVPKAHAYGRYQNRSFLLMEFLEQGRPVKNSFEQFGHSLAAMHRASVDFLSLSGKYGFYADNYIGAGEQINTPKDSWISFFRDCRIMPQLERARRKMPASDVKKIEHLAEHLEKYLIEPNQPSLLHGDLWSGNFVTGPDGKAWLIDPAVYVGCAEADIAMTELFGGFSGAFYSAYKECGLLEPGYEERRDLYNLYHMLNHFNLFGGIYLYPVERIIEKY